MPAGLYQPPQGMQTPRALSHVPHVVSHVPQMMVRPPPGSHVFSPMVPAGSGPNALVAPLLAVPATPLSGVGLNAPKPVPVEPLAPPCLTAGLPDPEAIERQKASYGKDLDEQLKQGSVVLNEQLKQQTDYLYAVGDHQKRQYALQIDQQIKSQEMVLAQQHNEQILMLQQAAQQQKAALEHQATALLLEYNQKKAEEDLLVQQFHFKKSHYETQLRFNQEMQSLQSQQEIAKQQVAHQHTQIAHQVHQAAVQSHNAHMKAAQTLHASASSAMMPHAHMPMY